MKLPLPQNRHTLTALLWMFVGTAVIFSVVLLMNNPVAKKEEKVRPAPSTLEVKKAERKKPKRVESPPQQRKQATSKAPQAPLPSISSALSGADFGIPQFQLSLDATQAAGGKLLGDMSNIVMTDEAVDQPPHPVSRAPLDYPSRARAKGITGYVLFNLLISAEGAVETVQILESMPSDVFDDVASAAIRQWRFEPAMYQGKKVKVWAKQKISFNLN